MQVLNHSLQEEPFRGQTFLGCDSSPITFQVRQLSKQHELKYDHNAATLTRLHPAARSHVR